MWSMRNKPVWAPEDGSGGGAADVAASTDAAADASSVLYPDEAAGKTGETDATADASATAETAAAADGEWKDYEPDPAKSDEENAAAKLDHDKKHPLNQVPEDGKYNLTMPEGIELDTSLLDGISPTLKELNLSHGNAQALVDKFIETQKSKAEAQTKAWGETVAGWQETAKKDPEIGGAKWDDTVRASTSAVRRFGTPALTEYLEASGAGNHPEIIRLMAKVGSMIAEDSPAISENPGGKGADDNSARMYPNDKPKGK